MNIGDAYAALAAERDFYKQRAIWWCAHAENGLRGGLDERDFKRAERIIEQEKAEKVVS